MPPNANSKGRLCGTRIAAMSAQRVVLVLEAGGVGVHAAARPPRGGGARFSIRTLGNGDYARGNGAYAKEETAITPHVFNFCQTAITPGLKPRTILGSSKAKA